MDKTEVAKAVGRLRRAMPRNPDVLLICETAEQSMINPSKAEEFEHVETILDNPKGPSPLILEGSAALDRIAHNRFMRSYMRRWRAQKPKANKTP